jgi:hypothetical protein
LLQNVLLYQDGQVVEKPILVYLLQNYGFNFFELIMLAILAFMNLHYFSQTSDAVALRSFP